jgi:hypothetical protein
MDGRKLANATQYFIENDINPGIFLDSDEMFRSDTQNKLNIPENWDSNTFNNYLRQIDNSFTARASLAEDGLHLTYPSTNGKDIRILVDRVLRRIQMEVDEG